MKKWLVWGIPSVLLLALVGWRFATRESTGAAAGGGAARGGGGAPGGGGPGGGGGRGGGAITVTAAVRRPIAESLQAVGNVISPFKVAISPKTSGRIEYLQVREGDTVSPGQVLVRLDTSELESAVAQQEANVAEARSRLAQAQLTQGSTNVGVSSQIEQQRAAVTSARADYSQVQRNYEAQVGTAQAGIADVQAKVSSAESAVRNAEATLAQQVANSQNAQTRYDRTFNLYKQGFIAAQDVDDARTELDVAKSAVDVARGQVSSAQSNVASVRAQLTSAQNNLSIVRRKGQADIAASRARVVQAEAALKTASANRSQGPAYAQNVAALRSSVVAAEAQLRQARTRLSDTVLKSPIKGTVTKRNTDPGTLGSPSQPILEVQFLDWLYVTTSIPIEQVALVKEGQLARITFDALPGKTFVGPISNVNAAADPQSRQFSLMVRLANPGHAIRPGMFGKVAVQTRMIEGAIVVPREAVTTSQRGSTVAIVDAESVAHVVPVTLGASDGDGVQILSGVKPGDRVVTLSYATIRDGQKVQLGGGRGGGGAGGGARTGAAAGRGRGKGNGVARGQGGNGQ